MKSVRITEWENGHEDMEEGVIICCSNLFTTQNNFRRQTPRLEGLSRSICLH